MKGYAKMQKVKNICDFRLSNFLSKEMIEEREFSYSGVDGLAEVLGYHIVFFRDLETPNCTTAISLEDANYNEELTNFVNLLLDELDIDLKVGDSYKEVVGKYGKPFSYDETIEGMKRYNYLLNDRSYFVCFGVDNEKGLSFFEIINNRKILDGIINEKWRG